MKTLILASLLISLISLGCQKTDPTPEVRDEIYKDLQAELEISAKAIESEEKNLEKLKLELKNAIPQTGQVKFATKKVRDTEAVLDKLRQQKIFFEIKLERRKEEVRARYAESLKEGGRPWPDTKEIEMYKTITQFQRNKLAWEKTKGTKKDVPRGTKVESGPDGATPAGSSP